MKPLDDITAAMFPTLAARERRMRRRELVATILSVLAVYVLGRDLLSAYQGRVATQNMQAMVGRVNDLEQTCQKAQPSKLTMTKVQAQDWAWEKSKKEREREEVRP